MLSPSDEAFITNLDLPSLRLTAEQIAEPRCEAAAGMRACFRDVPADYRGTRVALGHEIAKADGIADIARLLRSLETDPDHTLRVMAKAFAADEERARAKRPRLSLVASAQAAGRSEA